MSRFSYLFLCAFCLFCFASCKKKENTPAPAPSTALEQYTVVFKLYSYQEKYLFKYYDDTGTQVHIDTIRTYYDSLELLVTGGELTSLQSIQCLDTNIYDSLYINAYYNGKSISAYGSNRPRDKGNLTVGIELQNLLQ